MSVRNRAGGGASHETGVATRRRIEREAILLFGRKGFATSTMREIMSACELTAGAFYNHFDSKEELLYTIIVAAHDDLEREIAEAREASIGTSAADLAAVTRAFARWHCLNSERARVINVEYRHLEGDMSTEVISRRRHLRGIVEEILERGASDGSFGLHSARSSRFVAISVVQMLVAIAQWFRPDGAWTIDAITDGYEGLVLRLAQAAPTMG